MSLHTKLKSIIKPAVIIPSTLLFLTLTSALVLLSSNSNADTTSATASVTVPDTCYMSSTSTTHTGTVSGGTYTENFGGESTVTVTCNDRNGYSVYAVGYSNDIEGTNGLIGTSTGLVIPSGTSTSTNVSNWAMKLTPGTGTFAPTILNGYNNYSLVPATATKVATLTSDINVSNSSQFKTSYAVAVAPSQAADTYIGKVKYTVVHPNYSNADGTLESYPVTLGFGANTSSIIIDGTTYTSASASPNLEYGTHTISGTFPTGYELDSWSATGGITIADTSAISTSITVTSAGTLTLVGLKPCQTTISGTMQDFEPCSSIADGTSGTLTDSRDTNTYTVKKINGQWWMTQNLRYLGDTGSAAKTMTIGNNNSNVANKSITLYSLKPGDAQTFNAYDSSKCGSGSTAGYSNACVYDSGSTSTGVWYNYYAASGGTISTNSNSTVATSDICPKNWHLPTGSSTTSNTDFNKLVGNTTSGWQAATTGLTAFSAVAGGTYSDGAHDRTGNGFWWSATVYSATLRHSLVYNSSNGQFYGDSRNVRSFGIFVRCVRSS